MTFAPAFEHFHQDCTQAGLRCELAWREPLQRLADVLAAANLRTNLVGDASPAALLEHVAEALAVAAATEQALGHIPETTVDVGAGAGLEALTLALCWPGTRVLAVEPRALRHVFIREAADAMGLEHLQVIGKSLHAAALGPSFELATARAVWPAPQWLSRARQLLNSTGVVALHGQGPGPALAATLTQVGWQVAATREVPGPRHHAVAVLRPLR